MNIVTTLPITPRRDPPLGLFLQPFICDLISHSNLSLQYIQSFNLMGRKTNMDTETFLAKMKYMGIIPPQIWFDTASDNIEILSALINHFIAEDKIIIEKTAVVSCSCGRVETLATPDNIKAIKQSKSKGKLIFEQHNELYCKICCSLLKIRLDYVLLFHTGFYKPDYEIKISPSNFKAEFNQLWCYFNNKKILISRSSLPHPLIPTIAGEFRIDVDFLWQNIINIFHLQHNTVNIIVTSHKLMQKMVFALIFAREFGTPPPSNVILLPYIHLTEHHSEVYDYMKLAPCLLRAFLLLGWSRQKKISLEFKQLSRLKIPDPESPTRRNSSLGNIPRNFNPSALFKLCAKHSDKYSDEELQILSLLKP
ncbi:TPA: hypothetical protein DF272_04750 [Candidatus Falkowbacteria bacterium]|nr:hypothetical protein [Candidatus Falkowbacteria bacterium]